jgi:RNA polymerase sigma-70 factor (ECF subfamily)
LIGFDAVGQTGKRPDYLCGADSPPRTSTGIMSAWAILSRIEMVKETLEVHSGQVATTRSRNEIESAIRSFTPADWVRLKKVARYYSSGRPIEANDLLQEAFVRAIDGRTCPTHVDVVKFIAEAMRSIASGEAEKAEHRLALVSVAKTGDHQAKALNFPDPAENAEDELINQQRVTELRHALLVLFDDDPVARDVLEGIMEGMTAEELRELTDLDKTAYDTKRKLIRRRIDKAYPKGWKA